jgi:hypothetical protein
MLSPLRSERFTAGRVGILTASAVTTLRSVYLRPSTYKELTVLLNLGRENDFA